MTSPAAPEPDRRPIAARSLWIFQRMAEALVRMNVSANAISIGGMIAGILAGVFLYLTPHLIEHHLDRIAFILAAGCIQLRLLANMLDGMVALGSGKASPVGELYNEIPDRVSDLFTLVGAGYAIGGHIEMGYLAACMALLTAYVRAAGKAAGATNDFRGPMAKQQRMFLITIGALYMGLTPRDWQPTLGNPPIWGLLAIVLALIAVLAFLTSMRRLMGIAAQLRKKI